MMNSTTTNNTQKSKPNKKRFAASLFGLLWVAIFLNYLHIYVVHQATESVVHLGINIDDGPRTRDSTLYNSKHQITEEEEEEQEEEGKHTYYSPGWVRTRKNAKQRPKHAKQGKTNMVLTDALRETKKLRKNDAFFYSLHQKSQQRFIEQQSQNATSDEHRNRLEDLARQAFVDLENDEHPHIAQNISNNHEDPWFVLHIGPPKTATTTIQCGLEKHSLRLAKTDGYHFLGGGCGAEGRTYYMPNGEATVLRKQIVDALNYRNAPSMSQRHYTSFVKRASFLRNKGRSVVLSSELFGSRLRASNRVMNLVKHMIFSNDEKTGAGFNPEKVKIVLAYRHFVDWLPSFHYQTYVNYSRDEPFAGRTRTNNRAKGKVMPFLKYADKYLSNWEAHQAQVARAQKGIPVGAGGAAAAGGQFLQFESSNGNNPQDETEAHGSEEISNDYEIFGEEDDDVVEFEETFPFLPRDRRSIHPSWWLYQLWSTHFPLPNQVEVYDMHAPMNSNRPNDDIVTNFVCNMLPGAHKTCQKLMQMEDKIEQQRQKAEQEPKNGTRILATLSSNNNIPLLQEGSDDNEPDYDSMELHSRGSFLWQVSSTNTTTSSITSSTNATAKKGKGGRARPTMDATDKGISVRKSSNFDAVMIIEDLLLRNEIKLFDFGGYGLEFFQSNPSPDLLTKDHHKGHTKQSLIEVAENLLKQHNISAPDPRYYDCMPKELEDRLWNASLTFVEMMYKQTEMLTTSALASTRDHHRSDDDNDNNNDNDNKQTKKEAAIEEEKAVRYQQALQEHARLFEKNKAKGKYCDISPQKVFGAFPEGIHNVLTQLSFKPKYKAFRYLQLPDNVLEQYERLSKAALGGTKRGKRSRNGRGALLGIGALIHGKNPDQDLNQTNAVDFMSLLDPDEQVAAFHLGYCC